MDYDYQWGQENNLDSTSVITSQPNLKYQHLELTKKMSMLNIVNRDETEKCDKFIQA